MRRQLSSHFLLKVKSPCVHTVAYTYNIFCSRHSAGTRPLERLFHRSVGVPWALGCDMFLVSDAPWQPQPWWNGTQVCIWHASGGSGDATRYTIVPDEDEAPSCIPKLCGWADHNFSLSEKMRVLKEQMMEICVTKGCCLYSPLHLINRKQCGMQWRLA